MSKLITHIKRLALALCLATPIVSWAATTYSTDYSVTGSETAYTSSAGNANVYWQNFNFRAAVDKDNLEHGYYFFLKDGDTDIGETDVAVKLDSIAVTWGANAGGGIGASDTPYLVVTTADDSPVIIAVSEAGDAFAANGTSTFPFSNVVLASNAKYRFYFYKNDVSSLSVGTVLTGAQQARINGRWHNTQGDARADYNDIRCSGGTGYSINCSFVVSPLEEGDAVVLETGDASIPLDAADTPVVIEGKVVDGAVDVGSEVAVDGVLTVCGEATTLVLTDSLTATAFYFPATVTIDASAVSGLDPTGDDSSKTTTLLSGALKYMTAPTVVLPAATAGMIYETNVTASGISVTVVKGVDCVETITANTVWSDIKPEGWIDSVVGDKPSIEITYEGEEPVTLTFDEVVTAGTLTLTGNIVVEASAAATFGTVSAGAGSVVEMANMTITTQSGSGVYRYRTGYPSTVPNQGLTYEYVGTDDSENPGTVNLNGMRGVVRTTGYMSITGYYPVNTGAKLDVVSGTTSLSAGSQGICGYITIREGATLKNLVTDSLAYSNYSSIIDIYGTLDMGTSRWTTWSGAAINLRGGEVVGVGEGDNGALDFMGTCNITAYADSTISGNVKFRNALSNVTVNDGVTLTISGATKPGYDGGGITKKGAGTLKFTSDPYVPGGIVVEAGTLAFDTESDVDPVVTYTAAVLKDANMGYVDASNWKGRIVISAVEAGTTSTQVALNKTGNENSYLTLNGVSGNAWCANDDYTVQPAITLAGDVNFENGYSGKTVTFRKIAAGSGNLSLKRWSSCTGITYGFTTLDADNYTGTIQLDGSVLTFNVGDILKANAQPGDKVLPLTVANNATVNLSGAKVNGESVGLELKEDGIYIAVPVVNVTITVPKVPNATVVVSDGSTTYEPTTEGGASYVVPEGADITATYTADDGYSFDGATSSFELLNVAEGDEVTVGELVAKAYVASFNSQKYTTLQAAVNAWAAAEMMTAYMNPVTLIDDVTEASVNIPARADGVPCQLSSANKTLTGNVTIAADATLSTAQTSFVGNVVVNGTIYTLTALTVDGDITIADGGAVSTTSLGETAILTATGTVTASGEITITLYSNSLTAGTYPVIAGESVEATGIQPTVLLNNVEDPSWAFSVTETQIVLTGAAARVGDETYADFADAVTAAAGEETIELLNNIAYTLAVDETIIIKAGTYTFNVSVPAGYVVEATAQGDGVVSYTTAVAGANLKRERLDGDWEVTSSVDYKTVAEAIAEAGEDGAALRWTVTLLADATDITLDRAITVNAGEYDVTGTITVTVDGATVTVSNEPTLGADTWVTLRNNGTITVRHGVTSTVTVSVTGEGTAALETGDLVKATETAGTYSVKDGTNVKLTAEFGDEYKVDETSTYTNPTGTNTLPQPAAQQDYVMVPVNGNTTISVVIVLDTVSFEVAAVAGTTVVVMDGAVEVVPVAGVYTIPVGNTVQITWVEDADHIVTNGQTDWITPGDGTTVAAPAGMTVEDVVATIGSAKYASLQAAIAAATDGDTVTLLADATLPQPMYTLSKTITLNLNGKTLSAEGDTAKTAKLLEVVGDKTLTVVGTTAGSTVYGRINVGNASQEGNLTIQGGYYEVGAQTVVHVNGNRTNSSVSITGATIVSTADNGIQLNGAGTHTITDTSITGATAVYLKAGSLAISGTTTLAATGAKGAVTENNDGSDATGDALVIDNCEPPYQQITGVTIASTVTLTSANASAILVHARSGCTRQTKFVPAAVKANITEAVATEADVFDDYSAGIDPTDPTSSQEVVIEPTGDADADKAAAIAQAEVTVPETAKTLVDETAYKSYFELQAVETSPGSGVYTVTIVDIADDVKEEVAETAAEAIATNDVDGDGKVTVTVKPGLYYGFDANEELGSLVEPTLELATGTSIKIPKPGTTKGFIKVKIGTSAN